MKKYPVISLFSGALGLDLGLEQAGFEIRVAVEINPRAVATIRRNRPDVHVIARPIAEVTTEEILEAARLRPGEPAVVTGGPSCQAFSTAGQRRSIDDPRGNLFRQFIRVVTEARPKFYVMENVKGVLSAAVRHRPLALRGPGHPPLDPEEEMGSALAVILGELQKTGYFTCFDLLNTADYGVPQLRERLLFIGSRDGHRVRMPTPTHSEDGGDGKERWRTLRHALEGLVPGDQEYSELCASKRRYLEKVPEGGNWRDLPKATQKEALGGAFVSWGGRTGFFRRLGWDAPSPALTTRPDSKATMFCHPVELRPLSIAEYARIQQFPDSWEFVGSTPQKYTMIGNAVPVGLGRAVGEAIRAASRTRKKEERLGVVACASADLVDRISKRPRTVLNPDRMREVKGLSAAREWMRGRGTGTRQDLFKDVLVLDPDASAAK